MLLTRNRVIPTYLGLSRGLCRSCGELVNVRYVADEEGVHLERLCPQHGPQRALVAETLAWYLEALQAPIAGAAPAEPLTPRTRGCPHDCGPCAFHAQQCHLPVFSITNACNLRCPICFTYNRADKTYFMSREAFQAHIDFVVQATGSVDLINITGGEPTLHPELLQLLELAKRPEIGRITVNTNGIEIARNPDLARGLAELGAYVILSLDTLEPTTSERLHGRDIVSEKRRALENLARYDVGTTLLMVLVGEVNESELGTIVDLALERDHVRSLTIQTMTYTGQGGGQFLPRRHIPVEGVERRLEEVSQGRIRKRDFIPLPTAHPLCYGVNYLLRRDDGTPHALTEILGREAVAQHLTDGYLVRPSEKLQTDIRLAIDRLWSQRGNPSLLKSLKEMLTALYPPGVHLSVAERQACAERRVKTIYVHAHMDEDTYEIGRAIRCPDQVPVHGKQLISACNYNLFYRMNDDRFWVQP